MNKEKAFGGNFAVMIEVYRASAALYSKVVLNSKISSKSNNSFST